MLKSKPIREGVVGKPEVFVTGQSKTGHLWALQNRPLQGGVFISDFLMQARGFSTSFYLLAPVRCTILFDVSLFV
jgi:hypothetical protein